MIQSTVKPTTTDDVPDLQIVLDQTGLFPSAALPDMLGAALNGTEEALWMTCHVTGAAVGLCYAVPEPFTDGSWNMRTLAIRPDCQGKGLGRALVDAVEAHLRRDGQRILLVDTSGTEAFALTRKFYVLAGYEKEARIRDFWSAGDDKVTFRKVL